MTTPFIPRAVFPTLTSLPRSYYLGHHAAGLQKMRTLLNQIDLIVECRDYRIPLTSRNPMFEDVLREKERVVVYTKKDLGNDGSSRGEDGQIQALLRHFHAPTPIMFSHSKSPNSVRRLLDLIRSRSIARDTLTGAHCMVVGMPNVGKSTLLNALRHSGVKKGKVASTGAQPGVTRKIGTGVKIISEEDGGGQGNVYLLDTPGVFIPYVPDADAMLKLALCGSVKDTVIPPFTLADYLLYHINLHDPQLYSYYCAPTNELSTLLDAMARKVGRLLKGGEPDWEGTALWMVQRWRNGELGRFMLDEVSEEALTRYGDVEEGQGISLSQAKKAGKDLQRQRTKSRGKVEVG